jgi:murein L,D-transpeptidase YafK
MAALRMPHLNDIDCFIRAYEAAGEFSRLNRRPLIRTLLASAALAATLGLVGCDTEGTQMMPGRAMAPLSDKMLTDLEAKNMDKTSPILVRLFKTEAELEVWKQSRDGQYALLKTYPICRWSGDLGPKIKEGDRQAPEGFYTITPGQMNPNSSFYLAFNMGYPNAYDKSLGRTGNNLMIHGDCSSRGCYAMTDEQISEIYSLGRESFFGGQRAFQVQAYPFRMTPENMAKHRNSPHMAFWKMIKEGYDHFEVTRQEPKVAVCERRYVFDAASPGGTDKPLNFSAAGKCPAYEIPRDIADAVNEKKRQDEYKTAQLISQGTPLAANRAGIDGGMNAVFAARLDGNLLPRMDGTVVQDGNGSSLMLASAPGLTSRVGIVPPAPLPPETQAPVVEKQRAPTLLARTATPKSAPRSKEITAPVPEAETNFASTLTNMFRTASAEPKPADDEDVGLRGSDGMTKTAASKQKPVIRQAPKPASQVAAAAPAAAKPKPLEEAPAPRAAETRSAFAAPPSGGSMQGAQAVVPAGSFNSRWSGL